MDNAGSSTQQMSSCVKQRLPPTNITLPQVSNEISNGNRRSRRARLNYVEELGSIGNAFTYSFHNFLSVCPFFFLFVVLIEHQ
jgi:hypothetical protein